jgi:AbrB family transcriptional regulator (stage V sporulation protein T)
MMQQRKSYLLSPNEQNKLTPVEGVERYALAQAPIIASGDVYGSVMFLCDETASFPEETEVKLIQTAAAFLGKQMEE